MKYVLLLTALLAASPAIAVESEASAQLRSDFAALVSDINAGDADAVKRGLTADSHALIDEVQRENLLQCLKGQATVNSTELTPTGATLRATVQMASMRQNVRLKYAQENGAWKLDLPETLGGDPYVHVENAKARIATLRRMMPQLSSCQLLPIIIAEAAMNKNPR